MWNKIKRWWSGSRPCAHETNWTEWRYFSKCHTPMTQFVCDDCQFRDCGHVYTDGDDKNWEGLTRKREANIVHLPLPEWFYEQALPSPTP